MCNEIINYLSGKNIAILGFGLEGISTYKFIRKYSNMHLTIIDKNDITNTHSDILDRDSNITIISGDNYLNNLDLYDLVIKSPGVILKEIDTSLINITSQLELLLEVDKKNVIAITATKGKSTTVSLMYNILKDQHYDVRLLGNIGKPIFDEIETFSSNTLIVVEASALQLEFVNVSPHISAIINLYEDHLDHSGSVEHYHNNKLNIFKYQDSDDYAIYCSDIEPLNSYINDSYKALKYRVQMNNKDITHNTIYIDNDYVYINNDKIYDINSKRNLIGEHNLRNIMITLTIAHILNLDMDSAIKIINEFKGLEHRLELVGNYDRVIYYNDSIATIPNATINGIEALKNVNTLIFGGMDRGIEYQELVDYLNTGKVKNLVCMPTTGHKVGRLITNPSVSIYMVDTLEEAVLKAKEVTQKNTICLMSPAASSYEYFKNYIEKGNAYKKLVKGE